MRPLYRPLQRAGLFVAGALGLMVLYSCSLLVESRSQQCQSDQDCSAFGSAHCDTAKGICVGGAGGGSTGSSTSGTQSSTSNGGGCDVDGGIDGGGCYNCAPTDDEQFLNHCTGSTCIPFDNKARVDALKNGGSLPKLPKDGGP